jgi:predicted metal-dependent peptidase
MSASLTRQADGGETLTEQARIAARDETDYRAFLRRFAAPREILKSDDDAFDPIYYTYGLQTFGNMPLIEPPETREERRIEDLVIAIDTSMSTTGETVRAFLSTTYSILRTSESFTRKFNIRIIQCDDRVRSDTVITDAFQLKTYMDHVTLSGGSATDFRPVFAHVEELRKQGALPALRGLLYFTDGMGIYPTHRTDYETAFILPEEPPLAYHVPPWAIRIVLDMAETNNATPEDWEDELKDEMPEL